MFKLQLSIYLNENSGLKIHLTQLIQKMKVVISLFLFVSAIGFLSPLQGTPIAAERLLALIESLAKEQHYKDMQDDTVNQISENQIAYQTAVMERIKLDYSLQCAKKELDVEGKEDFKLFKEMFRNTISLKIDCYTIDGMQCTVLQLNRGSKVALCDSGENYSYSLTLLKCLNQCLLL